jgi:BetR domain
LHNSSTVGNFAKIHYFLNTPFMNQTTAYTNHWQQYHHSLAYEEAKRLKAEIERVLGISQSAFYRKIKEPQRWLTIAEKQAIARVYQVAEGYLFPELVDDVMIS